MGILGTFFEENYIYIVFNMLKEKRGVRLVPKPAKLFNFGTLGNLYTPRGRRVPSGPLPRPGLALAPHQGYKGKGKSFRGGLKPGGPQRRSGNRCELWSSV